jgi:predicted esterase
VQIASDRIITQSHPPPRCEPHRWATNVPPRLPSAAGASRVWFDRVALDPAAPEDRAGIDGTGAALRRLIDAETAAGVPLRRILLGGFSMGGGQALCTALGDPDLARGLAGAFALSSFLADDSSVHPALAALAADPAASIAPVLMCHGQADGLIPIDWGRRTEARLRAAGLGGGRLEWREYAGLDHTLTTDELDDLRRWIAARLDPGPPGP